MSLERINYWQNTFLPTIDPTLQFNQLIVVTQNPVVSTVGTASVLFTDISSETLSGAVIYGGPVRNRGLYSSHWRDWLRALFEVAFIGLTLYMTYDEWNDYRVTCAQAYNSRSAYFLKFWNVFDCIGIFMVYLLCIIQYLWVVPNYEATYASGEWPSSYKSYWWKTWPAVQNCQLLIYAWVLNFLAVGGRGFKYFRSHRGLGVFVAVFARTVNSVQDFLVWFVAIIGWLTVVFNLVFTLVGANPDFAEPGGSLNAIGLLTFGFYDYESLYNDGIGFGFTPYISTIIFWLLVFITLMFAQNIILAIVVEAYDKCSGKVMEGDLPFIRMTIRRLIYEILVFFRHKSTKIKERKVDTINTQRDDAHHEVLKRANLLARRDNHLAFCRGKVKKVLDDGTKFVIEYGDRRDAAAYYEETVRIGSIKAVVENKSEITYVQDISDPKHKNITDGQDVEVRFPYIWTEKLYLQYATIKSDAMAGFHAYFQNRTQGSMKFKEGWMFDRGIAIHKAWCQFKFAPGGDKWVRSDL